MEGKWLGAKQLDNVLKETHVVSAMIMHLGTDVRIIGQKGQSSSPAPNAKLQNDGKIPSKSSSSRGASPAKRGRFRADIGESVRTRHVVIGTLPCVIITSLKQDAMSGMSRRRRSAARSRRKVVRKDQVPYGRSLYNCVVYPRIPIREDLLYGERRKLGSTQERWARRAAWNLAKHVYKLKKSRKLRSTLPPKHG